MHGSSLEHLRTGCQGDGAGLQIRGNLPFASRLLRLRPDKRKREQQLPLPIAISPGLRWAPLPGDLPLAKPVFEVPAQLSWLPKWWRRIEVCRTGRALLQLRSQPESGRSVGMRLQSWGGFNQFSFSFCYNLFPCS